MPLSKREIRYKWPRWALISLGVYFIVAICVVVLRPLGERLGVAGLIIEGVFIATWGLIYVCMYFVMGLLGDSSSDVLDFGLSIIVTVVVVGFIGVAFRISYDLIIGKYYGGKKFTGRKEQKHVVRLPKL